MSVKLRFKRFAVYEKTYYVCYEIETIVTSIIAFF